MSRSLARGSGQPLWSQLYDDLTRRLEAGEFSGQFPGELALVEEYDVSRHTVREALRRLRAEGRVTASRGRTSRPAPPGEIEQPLGSMYSLVRDLRVLTDAAVAGQLGLQADTPLLAMPEGGAAFAIERTGVADGRPVEWRETVVRGDRFALSAEFSARSGYRLGVTGSASLR